MAFISCICLAFMFAIFEYGRVVMMQQMMQNAARAGARIAVVTPTSYLTSSVATADVTTVINNNLAGLPLKNVTTTIYQADDSGGYHRRLDQHAVRQEHRRPDRRRLPQPVPDGRGDRNPQGGRRLHRSSTSCPTAAPRCPTPSTSP